MTKGGEVHEPRGRPIHDLLKEAGKLSLKEGDVMRRGASQRGRRVTLKSIPSSKRR